MFNIRGIEKKALRRRYICVGANIVRPLAVVFFRLNIVYFINLHFKFLHIKE